MRRIALVVTLCALIPAAIVKQELPAAAAGSASMIASPTCGTISGFCFSPATITIPAGSDVTWSNMTVASHTSTSDTGLWNTGLVGTGQSATVAFPTPGSFPYHCSIHPDMKATVVVPASPPGQPLNVVALGGEASATVYWSAPASQGSSGITGYTVTSSPSGLTATTNASAVTATVTGLTDGTSYTFTVAATNLAGTGPPSASSNAVTPGRGHYHSLPPLRILDTRPIWQVGPFATPFGPGEGRNVIVIGQGGVPLTGVSAAVLNVTVTNTSAASYLTVYPAGVKRPLASNLNWVAGNTIPNLVQVALGTNGQVTVYNAYGTVDVVIDVAGYVSNPSATNTPDGLFNPVVPLRVLDTRIGNGAPQAPVGTNQTIDVQVTGVQGSNVPLTGVSGVVLNVTVTNPTAASYLTVFPTGGGRPLASNLNFVPGQTVPNRVIVKVGPTGKVSFYNPYGSVDVIADIGGWFTDSSNPLATGSGFVGVRPTRILDTRNAVVPLNSGETRSLIVAGGPVPLMTSSTPPRAVVLNVTITNPTSPSYLTVFPDGAPPLASDLNFVPGQTVPNLVVVKVSSDGTVRLFNSAGSVDVVVDVVGWYG